MTVEFSPAFLRYNDADPEWLARLPLVLDELARRWQLRLGARLTGGEVNYVVYADREDGTRCVVKVNRFIDEMRNEVEALKIWSGNGAARLLDCDPKCGAMLLERVEPGSMLVEIASQDDDAATRIAADVLLQLWRPVRADHQLRSLESWCAAYDRNRAQLQTGATGFPAQLFLWADALRAELLASSGQVFILHGDMHHYNVLRAGPEDWLAIDPKGLAGDCCFDVCQFFRNPAGVDVSLNPRRLDVFSFELGLDRQRVKAWCLVHAVLDACWDFEHGRDWRRAVEYAEQTQRF